MGVQTKHFSARSSRSIVLYPNFHSSGTSSDCDGYITLHKKLLRVAYSLKTSKPLNDE